MEFEVVENVIEKNGWNFRKIFGGFCFVILSFAVQSFLKKLSKKLFSKFLNEF